MPTHRTMMIREDKNKDKLRFNMDLLQERREVVAIRERNEASRVEDQGKLGPKWEGPYKVMEAYQNGSYKLQTMGGKECFPLWMSPSANGQETKKYYPERKTLRMSPNDNGQEMKKYSPENKTLQMSPNANGQEMKKYSLERKTLRMSPSANGQETKKYSLERKTLRMSPNANG
ncbi:hypothetical protein Tco_0039152 [Tanacetum coccineum]